MGDIKFFNLSGDTIQELHGHSVALEKSLQELIDKHLESLLGIRLIGVVLQFN